MRPHTDNDLLIAALENLYDVANLCSHPNTETYKVALKACRENSSSGKLHGLIIKLVGTEAAKKAQTAIEGWRKSEKKAAKDKEAPSSEKPATASNVNAPFQAQNPWLFGMPQFGSPWNPFSMRSQTRGRGRGGRQYTSRQCFICRSPEHMVSACPHNTYNKDKST